MRPYCQFLAVSFLLVLFEPGSSLDPQDSSDALEDSDLDGLVNLEEFQYGTDPLNPDTDGGGATDDWEVYYDTHPAVFPNTSSWALYDNDGDGMKESAMLPGRWFDPTNGSDEQADADIDDLCNFAEYCRGTDPTNPDTDGDGTIDSRDWPELYGCGTHKLESPEEASGPGSQGAGMAPALAMSWDCPVARTGIGRGCTLRVGQ